MAPTARSSRDRRSNKNNTTCLVLGLLFLVAILASFLILSVLVHNHILDSASSSYSRELLYQAWQGAQNFSVLTAAQEMVACGNNHNQQQADGGLPAVGYRLAYQQSYGFFDDVSDVDWKRAQHLHARGFPNHYRDEPKQYSNNINDQGKYSALMKSSWWYAENFQEEFHCRLAQRIPSDSNGDGTLACVIILQLFVSSWISLVLLIHSV